MDAKIKPIVLMAVKKAGIELEKRYYKFNRANSILKSHHEILTQADLKAEKIIITELKKHFPQYKIIAEESGITKNNSNYTWIIDPLDGTTNFSMHNPLWSTSVALAYKNEVIFGIIHAPMLKETYIAQKGKGAFLNGKKIKVSNINKGKILNAFCHGSKDKDIKKAVKYYQKQKFNHFDCRQIGSATIELAYVACGRLESIIIPGANPWDVGAGTLMVQEAGGKVTDAKNKKWNLKSADMIASNKKIHSDILKTFNS